MAIRKPIVQIAGELAEFPVGDALGISLIGCRISLAGTQTGINANTVYTVDYDTTEYDTNSMADLTNNRIVPTVAGYYHVTANLLMQAAIGSTATRMIGILEKNSTQIADSRAGIVNPQIDGAANMSATVYMNGTDYFQVICLLSASGNGNQIGAGDPSAVWLECFRISS